MPTEPTVSVVIPTFNSAKLLPEALESVLKQSYSQIEIIVVDDGSSDETKTVLEPFKEKIRYFYIDHKGAAHARNVGMQAATGKYIAFLDSDDFYYPYKLETQVAFIEKHPDVGMVYTEFSGLDESGHLDKYHLRDYHPNYEKHGWDYEDLFPVKGTFSCTPVDKPIPYYIGHVFQYTLMGTFVPTNTMLFHKKILETIGFQNESYRFGQDYEFSVRICKHCEVAFLNIPTYILRYHEKQSTRFATKKDANSRKDILGEIEARKLLLKTTLNWGYKDKDYYLKNREVIDSVLNEAYCELAFTWLKYGDTEKAKECFRDGSRFGAIKKKYRKYEYVASTSDFTSRYIMKFGMMIRKWKNSIKLK